MTRSKHWYVPLFVVLLLVGARAEAQEKILKPGNDLFIVINRGWIRTFDDRFESAFDRASSKLQYTFRF